MPVDFFPTEDVSSFSVASNEGVFATDENGIYTGGVRDPTGQPVASSTGGFSQPLGDGTGNYPSLIDGAGPFAKPTISDGEPVALSGVNSFPPADDLTLNAAPPDTTGSGNSVDDISPKVAPGIPNGNVLIADAAEFPHWDNLGDQTFDLANGKLIFPDKNSDSLCLDEHLACCNKYEVISLEPVYKRMTCTQCMSSSKPFTGEKPLIR